MPALSSTHGLLVRGSVPLAALSLPVALLLSTGLGVAMMAANACRLTTPIQGIVGGGIAVMSVGGLCSSLLGNWIRARRARSRADQISLEVEDEERLETLRRLSASLGVPVPSLRAVVTDQPLAFSLLDGQPSLIVSTWAFDHLEEDEWEALVAHELAHMRQGDRLYRYLGSLFQRVIKGVPWAHQAWHSLDTAMEEAADRAAIEILGSDSALVSARRKFVGGTEAAEPNPPLMSALAPTSFPLQLALACLGGVAALPLLPFVVVPLCLQLCSMFG